MPHRNRKEKLTIGKTLVESSKFVAGIPMGFIVGIIPMCGFPLGFLALQGIGGIERGRDEDWESFESRQKEQKPHLSFMYGADLGIVLGMIAQIGYWSDGFKL